MASIILISQPPSAVRAVTSAMSIAGHEVMTVTHPTLARGRRFQLALLDVELASFADAARSLTHKLVLFSSGGEVSDERVKSVGAAGFIRNLAPEGFLSEVTRLLRARV